MGSLTYVAFGIVFINTTNAYRIMGAAQGPRCIHRVAINFVPCGNSNWDACVECSVDGPVQQIRLSHEPEGHIEDRSLPLLSGGRLLLIVCLDNIVDRVDHTTGVSLANVVVV